ncbi:ADP-ribosylation family protein [Catellatospora methionotrophica]|uniref:ADP-ribosylation family protein n=1 Tax=Catellatospora methionotrophica TaxID=121620 RepID=UPI0033C15B28
MTHDLAVQRQLLQQVLANIGSFIELDGANLTFHSTPMWLRGVGWMIETSLYDLTTYRGPSADLAVVPENMIVDAGQVETRLSAAVAELRRPGAVGQALCQPLEVTFGIPAADYQESLFDPAPQDRARRETSLAVMQERFEDVADRFVRIYGLQLPRHMAVFAAFFDSLNDFEQRGMEELGLRQGGITDYFQTGGLDLKGRDGLDERLESRFRKDPPEFVTVMHGNTDGLHYGLWYDDPAEPPSFVAHNYARDSAETWTSDMPTPLAQVHQRLNDCDDEARYDQEHDTPQSRWRRYAVRRAVEAFAGADRQAQEQTGISRWAQSNRPAIVGSLGPALPSDAGDPRGSYEQKEYRYQAYVTRSPEVSVMVEEAEQELRNGKSAFALVLGRELHWIDIDDYRATSLRLLTAAYRTLGRNALAEIAAIHHAHRDLPSVAILTK